MKITATQWDHRYPQSLGEKVYIRTDLPCPADQRQEKIYRITVTP